MQRREFIGLIGGAAAWPLAARAQQAADLPLVAIIGMSTEQLAIARSANIREGLKQAGLIEGKDYVMTLRFADGDYARLPEIDKELDGLKPRVYHRGQWPYLRPKLVKERPGVSGLCSRVCNGPYRSTD